MCEMPLVAGVSRREPALTTTTDVTRGAPRFGIRITSKPLSSTRRVEGGSLPAEAERHARAIRARAMRRIGVHSSTAPPRCLIFPGGWY